MRAELKISKSYTIGYQRATAQVVDVTVTIPGYGCFTQTVPEDTSAEELEKLRLEGAEEIIRVIEKYSTTIHQPEVKETAKVAAAGGGE